MGALSTVAVVTLGGSVYRWLRMYGGAVPRPLILDLDSVLRLRDPAIIADAEARHGLPAGVLAGAVLRGTERLERVVTGRLTDAR